MLFVEKKNIAILTVIMFICPIASIPLLIWGILNKKHELLPLLSFVMATIAIISPPFADLYQHSLEFQVYKFTNSSLKDVFEQKDYILYLLEFLFAKWNFHFEWIRGIFVFVCYQIVFVLYKALFDYVPELNVNKKKRLFYFFSLFFLVPFIWIVNGLRSATSCYLLVYAWYCLYTGKNVRGWLVAILGVFTHFFGIVFIPLLLFFKIKNLRVGYLVYLFSLVLLFAIGKILFANLLDSISSTDSASALGVSDTAMNAYNGEDGFTYAKVSVNGLIAMVMERLPIFFIFVKTIFTRCRDYETDDRNQMRILFLLWVFISSSWIPFQRLSWLVSPIVLFLFLKNIKSNGSYFIMRFLLLFTIIGQIAYIYGYRFAFLNTPFYYLMMPLPVSLLHVYPPTFYVMGN